MDEYAYEASLEIQRKGLNEVFRYKPLPLTFNSPQIPHRPSWNWTWASSARIQRI